MRYSKEALWRHQLALEEYRLCLEEVRNLETPIWQTFAAIGIVAVGSWGVMVGDPPQGERQWLVAAAVGFVVVGLTWLWWCVANRWWSIQKRRLYRMTEIERGLHLHLKRDVDDADAKPEDQHQPEGVRLYMAFFPYLTTFAWGEYVIALYYRVHALPTWLASQLDGLLKRPEPWHSVLRGGFGVALAFVWPLVLCVLVPFLDRHRRQWAARRAAKRAARRAAKAQSLGAPGETSCGEHVRSRTRVTCDPWPQSHR